MWALKVGLNPGAPQGGSGEQYFLGSFDGKSFTAGDRPGSHGWTNYGKDDYCAISRLVNQEATWFWIFQNTYYAISKARLKGLPKIHGGVIDVSDVWLE